MLAMWSDKVKRNNRTVVLRFILNLAVSFKTEIICTVSYVQIATTKIPNHAANCAAATLLARARETCAIMRLC